MRHRNPLVARVAAAALPPEAQNAPCRTGKHSGPEGRNSAQNRPQKLPNVPSETLEKQ